MVSVSIGKRLANRRHELNKRRASISQELNIREEYLKAIEEDNYASLPGKAYISGFIKSYSDYLGLDTPEILKMLKATQDLQETYENMPRQLYNDYNRTKKIFMFSSFALIFVIVAFTYYAYIDHQIKLRQIESKSSSTETLTSFFEDTQKKTTDENSVKSQDNEENQLELYAQKSKPPFARVLLKAKNDVWFQIRPLDKNKIYVSKTLPAGKAYWVTPWDNVVLDVSSPEYMELIIDNQSFGNIGIKGKRIRGLSLNVEQLKDYYEKGHNLEPTAIEQYYKTAE